jgi:hypothetical protein
MSSKKGSLSNDRHSDQYPLTWTFLHEEKSLLNRAVSWSTRRPEMDQVIAEEGKHRVAASTESSARVNCNCKGHLDCSRICRIYYYNPNATLHKQVVSSFVSEVFQDHPSSPHQIFVGNQNKLTFRGPTCDLAATTCILKSKPTGALFHVVAFCLYSTSWLNAQATRVETTAVLMLKFVRTRYVVYIDLAIHKTSVLITNFRTCWCR